MESFYDQLDAALKAFDAETCQRVLAEREALLRSTEWKEEDIPFLQEFEQRDREWIRRYEEQFRVVKDVSTSAFEGQKRRQQFKMYE